MCTDKVTLTSSYLILTSSVHFIAKHKIGSSKKFQIESREKLSHKLGGSTKTYKP